jgi:hypothetical protein
VNAGPCKKNHKTRTAPAEDKFVKQAAMDRTKHEGVIKYIKTHVILDGMSKYKTSWIQHVDRMRINRLTLLKKLHATWFNEPEKTFE